MATNPDNNWYLDDSLQSAAVVEVFRWLGGTDFESLPNVQCVSVRQGEGPDPGSALFRYNFDVDPLVGPRTLEDALGTGSTGAGIVEPGDNLIVKATSPTGYSEFIFDGFVLAFEGGLGPGSEEVPFEAEGIAKRLWDSPIGKALYRNSSSPYGATSNVETDLPVHFNAGGQPNRTPDDAEVELESNPDWTYPVFFDQSTARSEDVREYWSLKDAIKYLLYRHNDESWVLNPPPEELDFLTAYGDPIDPIDPVPSEVPLYVPDYPADGKDLLSTCFDLVREYGFAMKLQIQEDGGGQPETTIKFFQYQTGPLKDVYLPPRGSAFDPYTCNVAAARLRRTLSDVANRWEVLGRLERYEASFVLAPGFPSQASDGSAGSIKNYDRSAIVLTGTAKDAYRTWVFNEAGDGYYANTSTTQVLTIPSLDDLLDPDDETPYVQRRRRPLPDLLTVGPDQRPLKARLDISTDYAGSKPGLWDGTGTWQEVTTSTWQLLKDRIGIWVSEDNPNHWNIGESSVSGHPYRGGVVRAVEAISGAESTIPKFHLRLTCVIEGDRRLRAVADRRDRSPVPDTITRHIDARDRFFLDTVAAKSHYNTGTDPIVSRDDTDKATAEAEARRVASETGVLDGAITIPYLTTQYRIGDRIRSIAGRNLGFRTDEGGEEDESNPVTYPVVTGISWSCAAPQSTTIQISDAGTARFKYARRMARARPDA